jgi:type I restriction enzyme, S subunit
MSISFYRFGELLSVPQKNGLTRPKKVRGAGVPMVNMGELFAHARIRDLEMDRVPLAESESAFLLCAGDLLFARQSLVLAGAGQCSVFLGNQEPTTFESHLIRCRLDRKRANPIFYFYFFRSPDGRRVIEAIVEQGAGASGIRGSDLVHISVPCPPIQVQDSVAVTLTAIDDRIALLRETNATLEAIAQALFKSWFVDFDPVRAKSQGLTPTGMDQATAALFPDSFEESALGFMPRGWECIDLAGLTRRFGGSIQTGPFGSQLHASDYVESGVPVVMPKDIVSRRVSTESVARIGTADADRLSRHRLRAGDIVFSRRGDVERHALITEREVGWLCGTGCLLLRPGGQWQSPSFLSMLLDAPRARTWLVQHAVGATMPNLNSGILGSVPVVLPSPSVLSAFEELVSATEEQRSRNASMAEMLASLRDTLLPRLISGQLRLPEAAAKLPEDMT